MARILIAEHNETTASYLSAALKKSGNAVVHADNCMEAWRLTSRDSFDILMVNIVMPGIDGFILAQKALQENPGLHVIFITGFAGVAMDTQATPAYAPAPVTSRPFHLREISTHVRYLMGQGGLPFNFIPTLADNNIVYADFNRKSGEAQQN